MEIMIANQKYFDCLPTKTKEPLWLSVIPKELEFCVNGKKHIAKWAYLCTYFQLLLIGLPLHLCLTIINRSTFVLIFNSFPLAYFRKQLTC